MTTMTTTTTRGHVTATTKRAPAPALRAHRWVQWIAASAFAVGALLASDGAGAQARPATSGARPAATAAPPAAAATGVVDVNSATEEQLQLLPGIGPTKARAVLAARQRMGRFRRVEDLLRVRGIGRATLRRIRSMVSLTGGTTMTARPATRRSPPAEEEAAD